MGNLTEPIKYANSPCDICAKPTNPTLLHIQWGHKEEEWICVCPDCGDSPSYTPILLLLSSELSQDTKVTTLLASEHTEDELNDTINHYEQTKA